MSDPFRVLVADPPWQFGDKLPGKSRGAAKNYACLSVAELKAFPLPPLADDAFLFLWRMASMQREALEVAEAWGFVPKTEMIWLKRTVNGKVHFGMGRTLRASHEAVLVCARGKPARRSRSVRSVFSAQVGKHSEKPARFFDLVEELAAGPYVELFGRRQREGWTVIGDQADLLPADGHVSLEARLARTEP